MLNLVPLVIFYCISSAILFWFDAAFCLFCVFFPSGFGPSGNYGELVLLIFSGKLVIVFFSGWALVVFRVGLNLKWSI